MRSQAVIARVETMKMTRPDTGRCSKYITSFTSTNVPRRLGYAHSGEEDEEGGDPVAVHMLSMLRDMRARSVVSLV